MVDSRMNCELHPDMFWNTHLRRCWACYPDEWQDTEGTKVWPDLVPDPREDITPASTGCLVMIPAEHGTEKHCGRMYSGRTVLGHAICAECYKAVSL